MLTILLACRPSADPAGVTQLPDPASLIAAFEEQRGADALAQRESVRVEGVVKSPSSEAPYSEVLAPGGRYRLETHVRGMPFLVGCDGPAGWIWEGMQPRAMRAGEQEAACGSVDLWAPIEGEMRVTGPTRVAERDTWEVQVEAPGVPTRVLWFDQDSGLMVARAWTVDGVMLQEQLLDWQDYDGVMLPATVVAVQSEMTFEKRSVAWDVPELPDFQMPDSY